MTKSPVLLAALVFPAFVLAGAVGSPALAQEKKMERVVQTASAREVTFKEIDQNYKLRVYEATYEPGAVSPSANRPMRVVHVLKGGTLERTFTDGTKEALEWKTGDTRIVSEKRPYSVKNIGKSDVQLLLVALK